jgi:HlyD family secretion protein
MVEAPARAPRRRLRWLVALPLLPAVAAAAAWWLRPPEVEALHAPVQPLARTLQFTARVQTPQRVEIGATITARVAAMPVKEGDAVAAGASLVQLEDDEARAATAQVEAAQAAVHAARARLDQAVLRSPAAGRVLLRAVEPGQIVQPGRALLALGVDGPVELVALVDERFIGQLQTGQAAGVVADAFPRQAFDARVHRLAPAVDPQRGALDVRLRLPTPPPAFLREDMTLSVEVLTGQRASARVLPLRVLRGAANGDRAEVLVAEDGRARVRPLKLGLRALDRVEVLEGLADGDAVLADSTLAEGSRVRVRLLPPGKLSAAAQGSTSRDTAGGNSPMAYFSR